MGHDPVMRLAEAKAWLRTADLSTTARSQAAVC